MREWHLDDLVAPLGGSAGRLLPAVERGETIVAQLERGSRGRWSRRASRRSCAGRAPAGAARDPRAARVLPRTCQRRAACASAAGGAVRGPEGRGADPDRGRERHPFDEPGRSPPAGGLRPGARPDPPGRAARALGLDPVPDRRLRRRRRHDPARIRRVRHPGHVPRSRRPPGRLARAGPPAGRPGRNSCRASSRSGSRPTEPI